MVVMIIAVAAIASNAILSAVNCTAFTIYCRRWVRLDSCCTASDGLLRELRIQSADKTQKTSFPTVITRCTQVATTLVLSNFNIVSTTPEIPEELDK